MRTTPGRGWALAWGAAGIALILRAGVRDRGVITDHMEFGRRVLEGLDLYAPYLEEKPLHPPYPPGFGLLTAPFSLMPERVARFAWATLQVLALWSIGASLVRTARDLGPRLRHSVHLVLIATVVLASRYILRDTHGGGGNLINLAMVLGACTLARRDRDLAAGCLLGFSLATKPTFLVFIPLWWLMRKRSAAVIAAGSSLGFTGIALALLGQGLAPLRQWFDGAWAYARMNDVFAPPEFGFPPFTWMNQCLRCATQRYLGVVPDEYAAEVPSFFPGLGWDPATTKAIATVATVGLLVATLSLAFRASRQTRPATWPWPIACALALSLLASPISWKAHHVALIPGFFLLTCLALAGRKRLWWLLGAYVPLCVLGEELMGKDVKQLQQSLYLVTAGTLAIWAACFAAGTRATRAMDSPDTMP